VLQSVRFRNSPTLCAAIEQPHNSAADMALKAALPCCQSTWSAL